MRLGISTSLAVCLLLAFTDAFALKLDVSVDGLEGKWQENVLALLAIYQEREDETLTAPRLKVLHRLAPEQIRQALAPFGLYRVQVTDSLTPPAQDGGPWHAQYRVDPGEPIKIGVVNYSVTGPGAENPAFPQSFPMKVGDVLLHADYEKAKGDITYAASQDGYLDFELVRHQVLIDPVAYEAIIEFHIDTGKQYFIGDVRFKQVPEFLNDEFLHRYVKVEPGAVYDPDILIGLQSRLLGTEYFEKVEMVPLKGEANDTSVIPIEVVTYRNKANKFRVGIGYATDVGPRLTLDWRRRYLGRNGHKFRLELSIAQAVQELSGDYRIPVGNLLTDYLTIQPQFQSYDTATRVGDLAQVQMAYSVVTPGGWRRTAGIDYRYEEYTLNDVDADTTNELVPNISWAKTVADDPIYTTKGYRIKYTILGAVEGLVSQASYISGLIKFKYVRQFMKDYRFITRTELGATYADSVEDLPASRRFYAGGDSSIRGWGIEALGPNNELDQTVGGRYLAVGSLELERRIKGDWSGAVFTDFGNAFDPDYPREWQQSVGVGLRWKSPLGQVRMDVAFALTKGDEETTYGLPPARLHLVIGPDL